MLLQFPLLFARQRGVQIHRFVVFEPPRTCYQNSSTVKQVISVQYFVFYTHIRSSFSSNLFSLLQDSEVNMDLVIVNRLWPAIFRTHRE